MLQALRPNSSRAQRSKMVELPPPTGGWVTEENILRSTRGTAVRLENFFPDADACRVRAGPIEHSDTGETTPVESLMGYVAPSGSVKYFGVAGGVIYDVTNTSGVASSITGLGNNRCQHVNFTTAGGSFLWVCNGEDAEVHYNGSTWAAPTLTGISAGDIANVNVFKSRLYFCIKNTLKFGYLPTSSIAGTVSLFDLGAEFSKGGYIMAMGTWTVDGGSGQDDHAIFITSEGEAAIYQGSDPSDANNWAKVGVYELPRPIGRRCLLKVGGDLMMITESGVIPISKSLILDKAAVENVAVTKNIQTAMNSAAQTYKDNFGWQIIAHPKNIMAMLNIPISEGDQQQQYVMNTVTGAWCKFTGMNASCWALIQDRLFYGGNDGKVYEANVSGSDNGADIICDMKLAFDYLGSKGAKKQWKLVQPVINTDGVATPSIGLNVDYNDELPTTSFGTVTSNNVMLDTFLLDTDYLAGGETLLRDWVAVTDPPGFACAVRMRVAVNGDSGPVTLEVNGFNLIYERGNIL